MSFETDISPALIPAATNCAASAKIDNSSSDGSSTAAKSYSRVRAGRHQIGLPFMLCIRAEC